MSSARRSVLLGPSSSCPSFVTRPLASRHPKSYPTTRLPALYRTAERIRETLSRQRTTPAHPAVAGTATIISSAAPYPTAVASSSSLSRKEEESPLTILLATRCVFPNGTVMQFAVVPDAYPKSKVHCLVLPLPPDPTSSQSLQKHQQKQPASLNDVTRDGNGVFILQAMRHAASVYRDYLHVQPEEGRNDKSCRMVMGFHA
eukprot:CAMPEP_0176439280 /NCGR_PEP_ID=MMETSP0127-20121128/19844_1 /TAXON_ID=938130 /ORGANISM="Platyophrya macrostoma, Strain WH" /LENGTH=201 /DNA_ID=CAMNT_0017823509 /DNA_START=97 /DNA_END=699 /DNA_ORIENTATION=+